MIVKSFTVAIRIAKSLGVGVLKLARLPATWMVGSRAFFGREPQEGEEYIPPEEVGQINFDDHFDYYQNDDYSDGNDY